MAANARRPGEMCLAFKSQRIRQVQYAWPSSLRPSAGHREAGRRRTDFGKQESRRRCGSALTQKSQAGSLASSR
jgi:hypothetical protein